MYAWEERRKQYVPATILEGTDTQYVVQTEEGIQTRHREQIKENGETARVQEEDTTPDEAITQHRAKRQIRRPSRYND